MKRELRTSTTADLSATIIGEALPNRPWEDKPARSPGVMWRYSRNPIIPRNLIPTSNSIFNSAVVPFKGEFAGVFRCDDTRRFMQLHAGRSRDGIHWQIEPERIRFTGEAALELGWDYGYDPRVCRLE